MAAFAWDGIAPWVVPVGEELMDEDAPWDSAGYGQCRSAIGGWGPAVGAFDGVLLLFAVHFIISRRR